MKACSVAGCDRKYRCSGFCGLHYSRWLAHGTDADMRPELLKKPDLSLEEALHLSRSEVAGACWPWVGHVLDHHGYGRWSGRAAHRAVYELLVGPIPNGLVLDHTCHDPAICQVAEQCPHRACVNPAHLEPVSAAENSRRRHYVKASCAHGHEMTPENTHVRANRGTVECVQCRRDGQRASYARRHGPRTLFAHAEREHPGETL